MQQAQAQLLGVSDEEVLRRYIANNLLRLKMSEQEVADIILFVTSPAGRTIPGQSRGVGGNVESMRRH